MTLSGWLRRLRDSAFALPLAVLAGGLIIAVSEGGYQQARTTLDRLVEMGQARLAVYAVMRRTVDVESSQRGYLLTLRDEYLAPFDSAAAELEQSLLSLRDYYENLGDAQARPVARELAETVALKVSEAKETIRLAREGRIDTAREIVMTNIGRDQMEFIRQRGEQLMALESRRVERSLKRIFGTLLLNRIGVATLTGASVLALILFLRQRQTMEKQRRSQQQALQAERDRLEVQVRRRTNDLTELTRHLQTAREDERQRLARELHDELGALLTAAKLDAARIKPRLAKAAPEALERLDHLTATLNSGIALKRRIIEDLRPSSLSTLGLVAALEIQCREFAERSGLNVEASLAPVRLTPEAELTVFRLVQEAFTNIAKYANARSVDVTLSVDEGAACIEVDDDGRGFDAQAEVPGRHGLRGMRYRVESDGGQFEVEAAPGRGTRVRARIPQQPEAAVGEPAEEGVADATDGPSRG
ncbi:CHASE3 domain-containing protein [Aquincola sp. S2]|uniref:CHASE3 domain-containing protein n=1 Tax=Pseudaquabacterium terrae TaxID=2732868 RepID=A0ABX2EQS9_9BURK|nr:CHASE3 domain-containing protein [Aquabacterium terrae]NRF70871.1 CHASE3 domain-containing protein [Aquabacterium terrae]